MFLSFLKVGNVSLVEIHPLQIDGENFINCFFDNCMYLLTVYGLILCRYLVKSWFCDISNRLFNVIDLYINIQHIQNKMITIGGRHTGRGKWNSSHFDTPSSNWFAIKAYLYKYRLLILPFYLLQITIGIKSGDAYLFLYIANIGRYS